MFDLSEVTTLMINEAKQIRVSSGIDGDFVSTIFFLDKEGKIYDRLIAPYERKEFRDGISVLVRAKAKVNGAFGVFVATDVWSLNITDIMKKQSIDSQTDPEDYINSLYDIYGNMNNFPREYLESKLIVSGTLNQMGKYIIHMTYKTENNKFVWAEPETLCDSDKAVEMKVDRMAFEDWNDLPVDVCEQVIAQYNKLVLN